MLTLDKIKNNVNNYYVNNGVVYYRKNDNIISDEQTILEVKSSFLIYNESKISYKSDINQFGKASGDENKYISKTMEKFAVSDEVNSYGTNKLINSLVATNGFFEEMIGSDDLSNSKFSIFVDNKVDYGISYLRLKCREHGFDLDSFDVKLDTSEFQKNGVAKVIIHYNKKEYTKQVQSEIHNLNGTDKIDYAREQLQKAIQENDEDMIKYWQATVEHTKLSSFNYSESNKLNELELRRKEAKKSGDDTLSDYYSENIKMTLQSNPIEVSPEQWDKMNQEQKRQFILLKMKESKSLDDKASFNYWEANLKRNSSSEEMRQMLEPSIDISEKAGMHR